MGDLKDVLDVSFRSSGAGTPLTAAEVFDRGYASLEQLILHNLTRPRKDDRSQERHVQKMSHLFYEWMGEVQEDAIARVTTPEGTQEYRVAYRTNMHPSTLKIPNIIYLKQEEGTKYIVRDARKHSVDTVRPILRRHHNDINIRNYKENIFDERTKLSLIPEPNLLVALETLERQGYPTITPPQKVISATTGRVLLIRDFLAESLRDSAFEPRTVGEYLGNLHAYGLMETLDRQITHYFVVPGRDGEHMVNIDPDVALWSRKRGYMDCEDLPNFMKELRKAHQMLQAPYLAEVKQVRAKVMKERQEDFKRAFLEAIKATYS